MCRQLTRWWLTGILILLPLQNSLSSITELWNVKLSAFINRLDEYSIIVLLPFALRELYNIRNTISSHFFILFYSVVILGCYGIVSGLINGNSILPTIHGTFDYIKYFFVIFIYAAFFRELDDTKRIFRILLMIGIFLSSIAFIQEIWALTFRYIMKKDVYDNIFNLNIHSLIGKNTELINTHNWRIGIYRVPSLMINHNYLGLYILFIFTIYSYIKERWNGMIFFLFIFAMLSSVSRVVYMCFSLVAGLHILKGRKWLLLFIIITGFLLFELSFSKDFNIWKLSTYVTKYLKAGTDSINKKDNSSAYNVNKFLEKSLEEDPDRVLDDETVYRNYTRKIAIEIWKKYPIWGAGPAMYGSPLSVKYNSPFYVYEKFKMAPIAVILLKQWGTIDQFWPQVLAELGIIGIILFFWIFITLAVMLFIFRKQAPPYMYGLFTGLIVFIMVVLIYSIGFTINLPPIIFTYFALIGITSGYIIRSS